MAETTLEQGLTEWQTKELAGSLDRTHVKQRKQGGRQLSYVEGHYVIREMNRIFGPVGWARRTLQMICVCDEPYESSDKKRMGRLVGYIAQVEVGVLLTDGSWTSNGWGYGEGIDYNNPAQAHEAAVKEAETDAMKRACILLGDPFGLELYGGDNRRVKPAASSAMGDRESVVDGEPSWSEGGKPVDFDAPKTLGAAGWTQLRGRCKSICSDMGVDTLNKQVQGALRNYKKIQGVAKFEDLPQESASHLLAVVQKTAEMLRDKEYERSCAELKRLGGFADGLDTVDEVQTEIAKIRLARNGSDDA